MVFRWKRNYPVSADEAGQFLTRLEAECGNITPALIVDRSRERNGLLHPCFEWDDGTAAEQYRRVQAGTLLRNLVLVAPAENQAPPRESRAFLSVVSAEESEEPKQIFLSVGRVMENPDYQKYVLDQALRELQSFQRKYSGLCELAKVFAAIDELTLFRVAG